MNENEDTFSIQKDSSAGMALFSILIIGFGIYIAIAVHAFWPLLFPTLLFLIILFSVPTQYEIYASRITRKLSITRHWISKQSHEEVSFDDILYIKVSDITSEVGPEYFIETHLKNGNTIRLTEPTGGHSAYKKLTKSAEDLEKFIKSKKL